LNDKVINLSARRKKPNAPAKDEETAEEFVKNLLDEKYMKGIVSAVVVSWDEEGNSYFNHYNTTWGDLIWYAEELKAYAMDDECEDEE